MHGDATITASTPVKNEPEILLEPKDPSLVKELPIFISVSKIIPIIPKDYVDNVWHRDRNGMKNLKPDEVFDQVIENL